MTFAHDAFDTSTATAQDAPRAPAAAASERIGRIVSVSGGRAIIMLNAPAAGEEQTPSPEIGTLLKVEGEETIALALVSALSSPMPDAQDSGPEVRIVEVEFIGELTKDEAGRPQSFRRGVTQYPGLGDVACRATREELQKAYAVDGEGSIQVGYIHQDKTIPAMVKLDDMLGKHFAILGTTGTGKSCSVALILRRILEKNPNAHILLLDVHREYASAFTDMAEIIAPENMNLPFWLLNFEEICEILVGEHSQKEVDTEVLRELIPQAKARYKNAMRASASALLKARENMDAQNIGVDTPLPYRASDLMSLLEEYIGKLDMKGNLAPYKRIKAKLENVTRDPRYAFMFGSLTVNDTMAEVLGQLFRIPVNGRPITVLELGGLPSEVINVVVSVLARLAFDFGLYSSGKVPITFVCEEAHRYVPNDANAGFGPTRRAISRIAKEGRKYGVSLCIITQRPSELDPTILSQCNTIFSLRLSNERDQEILRAGISDSAASLMDFMPTMGVGEAVAFGEGISLPTRIRFDLLPKEHLPRSTTAAFSRHWREDITEPNFLKHIVARWRHQNLDPVMEDGLPGAMPVAGAMPDTPLPATTMPDAPATGSFGSIPPASPTAGSADFAPTGTPEAMPEPAMSATAPAFAGTRAAAPQAASPAAPAQPAMVDPAGQAGLSATPSPAGSSFGTHSPATPSASAPMAEARMAGTQTPPGTAAEDPRESLRASLSAVVQKFRDQG